MRRRQPTDGGRSPQPSDAARTKPKTSEVIPRVDVPHPEVEATSRGSVSGRYLGARTISAGRAGR